MSTHVLPQTVALPEHFGWHVPLTQSTVPPLGALHAVHAAPQASMVSPLHAGVPELPPLLASPELDPLPASKPLLDPPLPGLGSSPTHAAIAARERTEALAAKAKTRLIPKVITPPEASPKRPNG